MLADHPSVLRDDVLLARWYVLKRLEEEMGRARRYGRPLSIALATLRTGEDETPDPAALAIGAAAAESCLRSTDLVGWLERTTFVVVLPETTEAGAADALSRWRPTPVMRSSQQAWEWRLGIAQFVNSFRTVEEFLIAAHNRAKAGNWAPNAPCGEKSARP